MNIAKETWKAPTVIPPIFLPPKVKHAASYNAYCCYCGCAHPTKADFLACRDDYNGK